MGNAELTNALKKLRKQQEEQDKKVADLLAKESEKWNSGQQRRRALYTEDRERGVLITASINRKSAMKSPETAMSFGAIRPDSAVFSSNAVCDSSTSTAFPEDSVIHCTDSSAVQWNGSSWERVSAGPNGIILKPEEKVKTGLDLLLMDVKVPSLDSLLMEI